MSTQCSVECLTFSCWLPRHFFQNAFILNKHVARYTTQLPAKQPDKELGCLLQISSHSMTWPLSGPEAGPQAITKIAYWKTFSEIDGSFRCSFWHKSAPFPCLLIWTGSWNRFLSWSGQACKVISTPDSMYVPVPVIAPHFHTRESSGACWAATDNIYCVFHLPQTCLLCVFPLTNC